MLGFGPDALTPPKKSSIYLKSDWTLEVAISDETEPGPDAGLVLGEAIHQLRSTLDHLVCALAMRTHPRDACEKFKLQFPIHKDPLDFCANHLVSQGKLRCLIGATEFDVIEQAREVWAQR